MVEINVTKSIFGLVGKRNRHRRGQRHQGRVSEPVCELKISYLFSHLIIEDKFKTQHDILQYVSHRGVDKIILIVLINFVFLVWSKIILERNDKRHRDCCSASSYDIFIYMNNHI